MLDPGDAIRDQGWKKTRVQDKYLGSVTLEIGLLVQYKVLKTVLNSIDNFFTLYVSISKTALL
jgi:hypothetical protein